MQGEKRDDARRVAEHEAGWRKPSSYTPPTLGMSRKAHAWRPQGHNGGRNGPVYVFYGAPVKRDTRE